MHVTYLAMFKGMLVTIASALQTQPQAQRGLVLFHLQPLASRSQIGVGQSFVLQAFRALLLQSVLFQFLLDYGRVDSLFNMDAPGLWWRGNRASSFDSVEESSSLMSLHFFFTIAHSSGRLQAPRKPQNKENINPPAHPSPPMTQKNHPAQRTTFALTQPSRNTISFHRNKSTKSTPSRPLSRTPKHGCPSLKTHGARRETFPPPVSILRLMAAHKVPPIPCSNPPDPVQFPHVPPRTVANLRIYDLKD